MRRRADERPPADWSGRRADEGPRRDSPRRRTDEGRRRGAVAGRGSAAGRRSRSGRRRGGRRGGDRHARARRAPPCRPARRGGPRRPRARRPRRAACRSPASAPHRTVTTRPLVPTRPATWTEPPHGARTLPPCAAAKSAPRWWPPSKGLAPTSNPRVTAPGTGVVHRVSRGPAPGRGVRSRRPAREEKNGGEGQASGHAAHATARSRRNPWITRSFREVGAETSQSGGPR